MIGNVKTVFVIILASTNILTGQFGSIVDSRKRAFKTF